MVSILIGKFNFTILTPSGKLLECKAGSIILPAADGMIGVLRNHAPMLCELGGGIIHVKEISGRENAFFLIKGGFVRVSENNITVLTQDVLTFDGMDRKDAQAIYSEAKGSVIAGAYMDQFGRVDAERSRMIVKMGELEGIMAEN